MRDSDAATLRGLVKRNALLIAAAPELRAVVKSLIDDREACGIDETDPQDPMAIILRNARGALAKTNGRLW